MPHHTATPAWLSAGWVSCCCRGPAGQLASVGLVGLRSVGQLQWLAGGDVPGYLGQPPARRAGRPLGVLVGGGDAGIAEQVSHGLTVSQPSDTGGCAMLISDTGSGRLREGWRRGRGGCRRNVRFSTTCQVAEEPLPMRSMMLAANCGLVIAVPWSPARILSCAPGIAEARSSGRSAKDRCPRFQPVVGTACDALVAGAAGDHLSMLAGESVHGEGRQASSMRMSTVSGSSSKAPRSEVTSPILVSVGTELVSS